MFRQPIHVLMEGGPPDLDLDQRVLSLQQVDDGANVHHLHMRELDEHHRAMEAYGMVASASVADSETCKQELKRKLAHEHGISHSTLQFEIAAFSTNDCDDSKLIAEH